MRRSRGRSSAAQQGAAVELTEEQKTDRTLESLAQNLKVIDIKRNVIQTNTRRLPFLYVGLGIFGFLLAGAILAISPILIFITGGLFSAVFANTFGPIGAHERRKTAVREIEDYRTRAGDDLYALPESISPKLFGFTGASKSQLKLTGQCIDMKTMPMSQIDERGALPFAPYKSLGMFFRTPDNRIDLKHPAMKTQYWLTEARLKGLSDDMIVAELEKYV